MVQLKDLFDMEYGKDNLLVRDTTEDGTTPLISSTGKANGIVGYVKNKPSYAKVISVPRTGTVCFAFYQDQGCCINSDNIVLTPKKSLSIQELHYIVLLIRKEAFKYSYGRKVTPERLGNTEIPDQFPKWVTKMLRFDFSTIQAATAKKKLSIEDREWKLFSYAEVFEIERGYYNKRPEKVGNVNFISASIFNNGVTDRIAKDAIEKMFSGNCITVVNNGHAGEAFYQKSDFTCSHDVNILRIKGQAMNPYLAMFLIPIIKKERYRFNYGRKWRYQRMAKSLIKLPVQRDGKPDWKFMEEYVKSLPYSHPLAA